MKTQLAPLFWGNLICGGFVGSSTDASTGAMWEYSPDHYYVTLERDGGQVRSVGGYDWLSRLNHFVLSNYEHLVRDASIGEGEYLNALREILLSGKKDVSSLHERVLASPNGLRLAETLAEKTNAVVDLGLKVASNDAVSGAEVIAVAPEMLGHRLGILVGDFIISINGVGIGNAEDFFEVVHAAQAYQSVRVMRGEGILQLRPK